MREHPLQVASNDFQPLATWELIDWTAPVTAAVKNVDQIRLMPRDDTGGEAVTALYEAEVQRDPGNVKSWTMYLERLKAAPKEVRFGLFERAVKALPRSYKLWRLYLAELSTYSVLDHLTPEEIDKGDLFQSIINAFERALVGLTSMPVLWKMYLAFSTKWKPWQITKTRAAFDRALQSLPLTQHMLIWPLYTSWASSTGCALTALQVYRRGMMLNAAELLPYVELLKAVRRWDAAAVTLSKALENDVLVGTKQRELWLQLCDILAQHPKEIVSLDVERVLRSVLSRYTDQVGRLWCSLANHFTRLGLLDQARDVFEEALSSIMTAIDFSIIFDSYVKFLESQIHLLLEQQDASRSDAATDTDTEATLLESDLWLERLQDLADRRPFLLSEVKLRQNPHNVVEWLHRAALYKDEPKMVLETFTQAIVAVDPFKAVGRLTVLWQKFAEFYETHDTGLDNARAVYHRAGTRGRFKMLNHLAAMWCLWVEMELKHGNYKKALEVSRLSLQRFSDSAFEELVRENNGDATGLHQRSLTRSVRLWSLCADMELNFGTPETLRICFERMFTAKVVTPELALKFTEYLEEKKCWEEAFRVYEKAVALFKWPAVYDIWVTYLTKFVARYAGNEIERARELFEQGTASAPPHLAKQLFLLYGKFEEEFGKARKAIAIYEKAADTLKESEDIYQMFCLLVAKTTEFLGVTKSRPIFEKGIARLAELSAPATVEFGLWFAAVEAGVGELDRARAIFQHLSQFAEPNKEAKFWVRWREFEIEHGNEETFKDLLRTRRTCAALRALTQGTDVGQAPSDAGSAIMQATDILIAT